nr:MAG TPA: hypothetical protein [Caudoviricetes sp.]
MKFGVKSLHQYILSSRLLGFYENKANGETQKGQSRVILLV